MNPTPNVRDIYLAKSITDLDKRSDDFPSANIKSLPIMKLCRCSKVLYEEAGVSYDMGDQELAYIKYNRYFIMLHLINTNPDYHKHKKSINEMLGTNRQNMDTLNRIEVLLANLKRRYAELATNQQTKPSKEFINTFKHDTRGKSSFFPDYPAIPKEPIATNMSLLALETRQYITCKELYAMVSVHSIEPKEILFDCRPYKDYCESKILHQCCLNVDEAIIHIGVTAGQLANQFNNDSRNRSLWERRGSMDHAIIYDWNTNEEEPINDSPLSILKNILQLWDPEVNYKSLKFLKGGFEEFHTLYPQFTTNPKIKPRPRIVPDESSVDDVEYATLDAIIMKEETVSLTEKNIPVINRDTKPEYLKKTNAKTLTEMFDVREKLADKAIMLERERLYVENEIKNALMASQSAQDAETKESEVQKAIELEYDLLQLETEKHDLAEESVIITDQISEEQAFVPDAVPIDKLKQIEEKECEAQKLSELNEKLARESGNRQITPTKIPTINRSVKPISLPSEIQASFEPVMPRLGENTIKGCTGLKNLGNSCFMNAILQCISNTETLRLCFLNGLYKNFLKKRDIPITEQLAELVRYLWCGKYKCITPEAFRSTIGLHHRMVTSGRQEDTGEFLLLLLSAMESELNDIRTSQKPSPKASKADREWLKYKNNNQSIIVDLFYGQMQDMLKCVKCNNERGYYQEFNEILVNIPPSKGRYKLEVCLDQSFSGVRIDARCDQCGHSGDHIQKGNITRLPTILILHLKRFNDDRSKNRNTIEFPLQNLDMKRYLAPSVLRNMNQHSINTTYHLYAVANHHGPEAGYGHYTAFCINRTTKRWYKYNDSLVAPLDEKELISSGAYILFYTRLKESTSFNNSSY